MGINVSQLLLDFVMLLADCCNPNGKLHYKYGHKHKRKTRGPHSPHRSRSPRMHMPATSYLARRHRRTP